MGSSESRRMRLALVLAKFRRAHSEPELLQKPQYSIIQYDRLYNEALGTYIIKPISGPKPFKKSPKP